MITSFKLSNKRAVKDQPDVRTTSTNGTMQFSLAALKAMGVGPKQYLLFFSVSAAETGLVPTLPGSEETVIILQGVDLGENGAVGNMVSEAGGKYAVSSSNIYNQLGGNDETLNEFDIEAAHYGFALVNGKYQPITDETPNDLAGVTEICAYTSVKDENGAIVDVQMADVAATIEEVKAAAVPFFPVIFLKNKPKQVKGEGVAKTAKATAPTETVDLAGFEDEEA